MRKFLWLMPALLLAGCRGEQVAFQFQPAASTLVTKAKPATPATAPGSALAPVAPAAAVAAPTPPRQPHVPPRRLAKALVALPLHSLPTMAAPVLNRPLAHRLLRKHATEGVAENGLGGIALFFIGVVLAILAGLGALFALIPGVSFWGGVGLAAAALVVLYLLYSLVSGGKKKKA